MDQILTFRFITTGQAEWLTEDGQQTQGTLEELAGQLSGRKLLLAAAGERITLTRATVPGRHRSTWLRAIPYALEDSLADDVETLHFATGDMQPDGSIPVAVIQHGTIKIWLEACAEAGITPAAVVADLLLLPYEAGSWSLLMEDERALVRTGPWSGFVTEQEQLVLLLNLALAQAGEQLPQRLRVWGEVAAELVDLNIEIQCEDAHPEPLRVFAEGYDSKTALNLLQGPYSRRAHLGRWLRPWRAAAVLAGVWLGFQIVFQATEYWQLQREQSALQAEMERIFKEAVPQARRIVNPRVQLENRLRELRQGEDTTEGVFLDLLYRGGQSLIPLKDITLQGLRYRNRQLDLDLEGKSLEILDQLRQRYGEQPDLKAQMRTTKQEDKVRSQVTLTKAAS